MAHEKTKEHLRRYKDKFARSIIAAVGKQMGFDSKTCSSYSPRVDNVIFVEEQTIRYIGARENKFGENVPRHFINDGVLYICPGQWGLNEIPTDLKSFTVGFEIKENASDLRRDEKILYYLGWTDFYFILVPRELRDEALIKLKEIYDDRIGLAVFSYYGDFYITKVPQRQQVYAINQLALAYQALFSKNGLWTAQVAMDPNETGQYLEPNAYSRKYNNINYDYVGEPDTYVRHNNGR